MTSRTKAQVVAERAVVNESMRHYRHWLRRKLYPSSVRAKRWFNACKSLAALRRKGK